MSENSEQPDQVKKKLTKRELWLIGAVALLLVATAGLLIYILIRAKHSPTPTPQNTVQVKQPQTTQALKPDDVINKIKSSWQGKYKLVDLDNNNHPTQDELAIRLEKSAPPYKVTGYNFYVRYNDGASLSALPYDQNPADYTPPKADDVALRKEIAHIYEGFGLIKNEVYNPHSDGPINSETSVYFGQGLICTVEDAEQTSNSVTAKCGLVEAYKNVAKSIEPFARITPDTDANVVFAEPVIKDSPVAGYQKASIGIGNLSGSGYVGLYYRKGQDDWVFFKGLQASAMCSDYNTTDLQNAFRGDVCVDANNNSSTVQ